MKKNGKKKIKYKDLTKQDKALLITFSLLVILVIGLTIYAINLKNIVNNKKSNITIPVLDENTESEISVDISGMKEGETKEYIFKVTNYKEKSINTKQIQYTINLISSDKTSIKLYKNKSDKNLISKNDTIVENNELPKDTKSEDEYHLIIRITEQPEKTDKITLKINS